MKALLRRRKYLLLVQWWAEFQGQFSKRLTQAASEPDPMNKKNCTAIIVADVNVVVFMPKMATMKTLYYTWRIFSDRWRVNPHIYDQVAIAILSWSSSVADRSPSVLVGWGPYGQAWAALTFTIIAEVRVAALKRRKSDSIFKMRGCFFNEYGAYIVRLISSALNHANQCWP